jgi:6-methylsalicylate decarboxylase
MSGAAAVDVHQHLWTEGFLEALAARREAPCARRVDGRWRVEVPGDVPAFVDPLEHDPARRAAALRDAGLDAALLVGSLPLGVEALPGDAARAVLDAWLDDVLALGGPFGAWASVPLDRPTGGDVVAALDRGAVGIALPAAALATPEGVEAHGDVLAALEHHDAPLLVHPGAVEAGTPDRPAWWPAMTGYLADLHAAWHAFVAWGRPAHPALRVCFVALAGGAPLHVERLAARGGPVAGATDPGIFYDTSSYGPRAIDAMARIVGIDQLVHGSDAPVVAAGPPPPDLGPAAQAAMAGANVARLLGDREGRS